MIPCFSVIKALQYIAVSFDMYPESLIFFVLVPNPCAINPLPHGVPATFFLTAVGPIDPPKKDDISREKTILMPSLRTHRSSAVSRDGLYYSYPPLPPSTLKRSLCTI